jgi:hypothetical protein
MEPIIWLRHRLSWSRMRIGPLGLHPSVDSGCNKQKLLRAYPSSIWLGTEHLSSSIPGAYMLEILEWLLIFTRALQLSRERKSRRAWRSCGNNLALVALFVYLTRAYGCAVPRSKSSSGLLNLTFRSRAWSFVSIAHIATGNCARHRYTWKRRLFSR